MSENFLYASIINDEMAEGTPETHEAKDPTSAERAVPMPPRRGSRTEGPKAETGFFPAVVVQGEGEDDNDAQDASRTTAETHSLPQAQSVLDDITARPPHVLIVEDTVELAEVIQVTLERMDLHAVYEPNAGRALARYTDMQPDVVLLDITLPDMSGWKLLDAIRDLHRETGAMPIIIIITALGDAANRLLGKFQNVYTYLQKPFTPDEVERVVREALNSRV